MSAKPSVLGGALAGLRPAEGQQKPEKRPTHLDLLPNKVEIDNKPIGVLFRMNPRDHEIVSAYSRDKKMSVQELIEAGINTLRVMDGLAPIEGRPRSRTRLQR